MGYKQEAHDAEFLMATRAELRRAHEKFPDDEDHKDDGDWLAVLVEEVGECARAMNDLEGTERLREELVQVAAMASRWASAVAERAGLRPVAG